MGSAHNTSEGEGALAAEGHAQCARWFAGDGVGGGQQRFYRCDGRGGATGGLVCRAFCAEHHVARTSEGQCTSPSQSFLDSRRVEVQYRASVRGALCLSSSLLKPLQRRCTVYVANL